MGNERNREAEMEAGGIAHRRVAAGNVGMDGVVRLNIGEGRDDDAPDALDGVERQQALMAQRQALHHVGLAAGPEGRPRPARPLGVDQRVDDRAALDQETVHLRVDRIDLGAEIGERPRVVFACSGHGYRAVSCRGFGPVRAGRTGADS
jgi:hypothetical protein